MYTEIHDVPERSIKGTSEYMNGYLNQITQGHTNNGLY